MVGKVKPVFTAKNTNLVGKCWGFGFNCGFNGGRCLNILIMHSELNLEAPGKFSSVIEMMTNIVM